MLWMCDAWSPANSTILALGIRWPRMSMICFNQPPVTVPFTNNTGWVMDESSSTARPDDLTASCHDKAMRCDAQPSQARPPARVVQSSVLTKE